MENTLACPNPHCVMSFSNSEEICHHLGLSSTGCSEWATEYISHTLELTNSRDDEEFDGETPDDPSRNLHHIYNIVIDSSFR
jgi:hypothetical protein